MNDIYLPWNCTFFLNDTVVKNYEGLQYGEAEDGKKIEPKRYEAVHSSPPKFYIYEVERARAKIKAWLQENKRDLVANTVLDVDIEYCKHGGETLTTYKEDKNMPTINPCEVGQRKKKASFS